MQCLDERNRERFRSDPARLAEWQAVRGAGRLLRDSE
jgi:hypothetical protein